MLQVTKVVRDGQRTVLDLLDGAKMEPLSPSIEDAYCVMKGTIPPGVSVPIHSHADAESFYVLSGEGQALVGTEAGLQWQTLRRLHPHSWRSQACVEQCFWRADGGPDYMYSETWPCASGYGTARERSRQANS